MNFLAIRLTADVAPLAGAWIETRACVRCAARRRVAPLAGAWIETSRRVTCRAKSLVAPLAGAWIETAVKPMRQLP